MLGAQGDAWLKPSAPFRGVMQKSPSSEDVPAYDAYEAIAGQVRTDYPGVLKVNYHGPSPK